MEVKAPSTALFGWLSVGYLAVAIVGAWLLGYFDPGGTPIAPNEWGDVLAGVFSPLAFLWLIYAALSQRAELALQRAELTQNNATQRDQQKEMQNQANAFRAQLKRIEAEADAKYEPIIVMEASSTLPDYKSVSLRNVGGTVLEVTFDNFLVPMRIFPAESSGQEVRQADDIVTHWRTNELLIADFQDDFDMQKDFEIRIVMNRLDNREVVHVYMLTNKGKKFGLMGKMFHYDDGESEG